MATSTPIIARFTPEIALYFCSQLNCNFSALLWSLCQSQCWVCETWRWLRLKKVWRLVTSCWCAVPQCARYYSLWLREASVGRKAWRLGVCSRHLLLGDNIVTVRMAEFQYLDFSLQICFWLECLWLLKNRGLSASSSTPVCFAFSFAVSSHHVQYTAGTDVLPVFRWCHRKCSRNSLNDMSRAGARLCYW